MVNGGICATFDVSTGKYISYLQVMGDRAYDDFPRIGRSAKPISYPIR